MTSEAFKNVYNGPFKQYRTLSGNIGGQIGELSGLLDHAFQIEAYLLDLTEKYKIPVFNQDQEMMTHPVLHQVSEIHKFVAHNQTSPDRTKLELIAIGSKLLSWIIEEDTTTFIETINNQIRDHIRVTSLMESEGIYFDWIHAFLQTISDLSLFITNYFRNGLTWIGSAPLPPAILLGDIPLKNRFFDHSSLFKEINRGESIIRILKKQNEVKEIKPVESKSTQENPPLDKWRLEHRKGDRNNLIVDTTSYGNEVFIFNCVDCTVVIENPLDWIILDSCKNMRIVFRSVYLFFKILNCTNLKLHSFGDIPEFTIEDSEKITIFLTNSNSNAQIYSVKSNDLNVMFPYDDEHYRCHSIPSQMLTTLIPNQGLKTTVQETNSEFINLLK